MLWVWGRQGQGQGPRQGHRHVTVGGTQQETSHDGVIMCRAKGMGPDAIRQQAWNRGDARYIGRHGPRGNAKGGNGKHK